MKREKARPHSVELAVCVYVPKFSELLRPDRIKKRCWSGGVDHGEDQGDSWKDAPSCWCCWVLDAEWRSVLSSSRVRPLFMCSMTAVTPGRVVLSWSYETSGFELWGPGKGRLTVLPGSSSRHPQGPGEGMAWVAGQLCSSLGVRLGEALVFACPSTCSLFLTHSLPQLQPA